MGRQTALSALVKNETLWKWFFEHGADPNLGPLYLSKDSAPTPDSGSVFDLLLHYGAKLENSQPLHMAAASQEESGSIQMMEYLIGKGVDVNASDQAPTTHTEAAIVLASRSEDVQQLRIRREGFRRRCL